MCAKYGRSRMNDVHTISMSDLVSPPRKCRMVDSLLFGF